MKITRPFLCEFGMLIFAKSSGGYRILWLQKGQEVARYMGWSEDKPTDALARFYIRRAVAEDRSLPPYTFTDANIDPTPIDSHLHGHELMQTMRTT